MLPSEGSISEAYLSGDQENSIISELTTSPIVAASLGQVYKGRLKENGGFGCCEGTKALCT